MFYKKLFVNNTELTKNYRVTKTDKDGNMYIDDDCKKILDVAGGVLKFLERPRSCDNFIYNHLTYNVSPLVSNIHLVYTNSCKDAINNFIYDTLKHKFSIKRNKSNNSCYDLIMTKGLRLRVEIASKSNGVFKSVIYEVISDIDEVGLKSSYGVELRNVNTGKIDSISVRLVNNLVLGFAVTTHASQGLTIREKCCVHEVGSMIRSDTRILYTAITRLTKYSDLVLVDSKFGYRDNKFRGKSYFSDESNADDCDVFNEI